MGQRVSFTISLCLCFVFSTLHNSILVVSFKGRIIIHPEFIPESASQYPTAGYYGDKVQEWEGTSPGGRAQLFLAQDQDGNDVATLQPMLVKMATAINALNSRASQEGSDVDVATLTVAPSVAQLGCSIYASYQSYCKVGAFTTSSFCIENICVTTSSSDLFASCACYSSTYWVPDLYDNAVYACNQASSTPADFTPSITTVDGKPTGFCNWNNPRNAPVAYGLGATALATTTAAAATTTSPAATTAPTTTPASPASPTQGGSASSFSMTGSDGIRRAGWALVGTVVVIITLACV